MINDKIKPYEGLSIIVIMLCSKLFLFTPYLLKNAVKTNVVLLIFLLFLPYLLIFFLKDIGISIKSKAVSKTAKIVTGIIFFMYYSCSLYLYSEGIKKTFFPETDVLVFAFSIAVISAFAASKGLSTIGKLSGFFMPILVASCTLFVYLAHNSYDYYLLLPAFNFSKEALTESTLLLSALFETLVFYLTQDEFEKSSQRKIFLYSVGISFVMFVIICAGFVAASLEKSSVMPMFMLVRLVEIKSFFQRADTLFLLVFVISMFLYLSTLLYFMVKCLKELINVKKINVLTFCISFISLNPFIYRYSYRLLPYVLLPLVFVPLFLQEEKKQ